MTDRQEQTSNPFELDCSSPGQLVIRLGKRIDLTNAGAGWDKLDALPQKPKEKNLLIDAGALRLCDTAGMGLLLALEQYGQKQKMTVQTRGLSEELKLSYNRFDSRSLLEAVKSKRTSQNLCEQLGRMACDISDDILSQISFVGQFLCAAVQFVKRYAKIRWRDIFTLSELVGVNAVGITLLLGALFGLIMAFSSAMPLRQFGVEVYVSDLVAVALVRVLGPFITAIILAGRTGSAFAAEIGTMKINNELDALEVMGLNPVRFLCVPRVFVTILAAPLLTVLFNVAGLAGSAVVIVSLGFSVNTYWSHVQSILTATDIWVGLGKALVFGGLVGWIGCLRGLQTKSGAGAVGISTTRAVVSGIVLIVLAEGVFSVLLYYLNI